jgi:DNA-binding NarL/FixJ family response regulator
VAICRRGPTSFSDGLPVSFAIWHIKVSAVHLKPPYRVFIAEDSHLFQHALRSSLSLIPNIEVVGQAFTGADAIAGIRRTKPDLVLLDIMMPEGDGFCVLRSIGRSEKSPTMVVLTFLAQESVRKACAQLGAHLFFDKADAFQPLMTLLRSLSSGEVTKQSLQESTTERLAEI